MFMEYKEILKNKILDPFLKLSIRRSGSYFICNSILFFWKITPCKLEMQNNQTVPPLPLSLFLLQINLPCLQNLIVYWNGDIYGVSSWMNVWSHLKIIFFCWKIFHMTSLYSNLFWFFYLVVSKKRSVGIHPPLWLCGSTFLLQVFCPNFFTHRKNFLLFIFSEFS